VALGDLILKFLPFMILVHYHEINLTGKSSNFVHREFEGGRVTILLPPMRKPNNGPSNWLTAMLWQEWRGPLMCHSIS
jgi:hypothetical protein